MKTVKTIAIAALAAYFSVSCDMETSDNGELDGFWHMVKADTLSTGGTCDMSGKRIFWGIQSNLLNVADYDGSSSGYMLHFEYTGTTLRTYDAYKNNRAAGDIKVEDHSLLSPFGINALDETFNIERLGSSRMTLATDSLKLEFRKM